jgi:Tol biopolymer transport system component
MNNRKLSLTLSLLVSSIIVSCSTAPLDQRITAQSTPIQLTGDWQEDRHAIKGILAIESGSEDGSEIYTLDLSCLGETGSCDEALTQLVDNPRIDRFPYWSPVGSQILFASDREDDFLIFDLYLMNWDGTDVRQLTDSPLTDLQPSWSPTGDTIAYVGMTFYAGSIYTYNLEEGKARLLPELQAWNRQPTWSPDGQKIAFVAGETGYDNSRDLCVIDMDDDSTDCLTDGKYITEEAPSWSHDGESLVFSMREDDTYNICVIEVQTGIITYLTDGQRHAISPTWSPDGSKIAYLVSIGDNLINFDLFVMNTNGSQKTRITQSPHQERIPIWSKDGEFIVFTTLLEDSRNLQVQIASSSGSWVKPLTSPDLVFTASSLFEGQ